MSYNEKLADRIRERMAEIPGVEEKHMFGGIAFMVDNKMCVGIIKDEMMCRINPDIHDQCVEMDGCRTMDFNKRPMKGYVMIDESGMKTVETFEYWIGLTLEFNKQAKASLKKPRSGKKSNS
jgi:TfoX/Sxy family transcriptional regulator of competence genes